MALPRDISAAVRYLPQDQQPRVIPQIMNNRAVAQVDRTQAGDLMFLAVDREKNQPYAAKMFDAVPLGWALAHSYPPANPQRTYGAQGKPLDQSWYLTSYTAVLPTWSDPTVYESPWDDPEFQAALQSHTLLPSQGFRLAKYSPRILVDAGVLKYKAQIAGTIAMLDGDLCDLYPKTNEQFVRWYRDPDPKVVEKLPWSDEIMDYFLNQTVPMLRAQIPWIDHVAAWYTTENGWRTVVCLSRPVPVAGQPGCLEDITRGMALQLALAGVGVDTACVDWTRLMRVPRCFKQNRQIGQGRFFRMSWNGFDPHAQDIDNIPTELKAIDPEALPWFTRYDLSQYYTHPQWETISRSLIGRSNNSWADEAVNINVGAQPAEEEIFGLLHVDNKQYTANYKRLKDKLLKLTKLDPKRAGASYIVDKAQQLYHLLFEGGSNLEAFAINHGRASSLHYGNYFAIWDLCTLFREDLGVEPGKITPQLIYAITVDPYIRAMEARAAVDPANTRSNEEVRGETWRAVVKNFEANVGFRESAKKEEEEQQAKEDAALEEEERSQRELIIDYLQGQLNLDRHYLEQNFQKYLLLVGHLGVSVLQIVDGRVQYTNPSSKFEEWVSKIRDSGHNLIRYKKLDNNGEETLKRQAEICSEYSIGYGKRYRASRLIETPQVERGEADNVNDISFICKLPGLSKNIVPTHHPQIQEWLEGMAGPNVEIFMDWLACFCRIDRPLPALYLKGPPGIGKGMLLEGLKLLTESKMFANFEDAMGGFQDFFEDTFLLAVDEDASVSESKFHRDVVGVLRRTIGGQMRHINLKNVKGVFLEGEWRLVIFANNDDILQIQKDLNNIDIEALNCRIFYLNADDREEEIKRCLYKAGDRFGNELGRGTEADQWPLKIAQHVKWLEHNRKVQHGERFLIKPPSTDWHEQLRVTSAGGALICKAIAAVIESNSDMGRDWCFINRNKCAVYIKPAEFENYIEKNYPKYRGQAVKSLARLSKGRRRIRTNEKGLTNPQTDQHASRPWCYEVDIPALMRVLDNRGYDVDFREAFGERMWTEIAPENIQQELAEEDSLVNGPGSAPKPNIITPWQFQQAKQ